MSRIAWSFWIDREHDVQPAILKPLLMMAFGALTGLGSAAHAAPWTVVLIEQAGSMALQRSRLERAYPGHSGGSAADGAAVALEEAQFELKAPGVTLTLRNERVTDVEAARSAALKAQDNGAPVLLVNLPAPWISKVAGAVRIPVINVGSGADVLRESECRANLYHVLPSERMRADALAQALAVRKWTQVLLLTGPTAEDASRAAVAGAAIKRYGLNIAASRPFKPSADPRERAVGNVALLTGNLAYDVVWVVDSDGEFARTLPYNTAAARPVVGDGGLVALAWHNQFERFGAPQLSRRFFNAAKRPMTGHDWASWVAGKAIVALAVANPKATPYTAAKALGSVTVDGSKGVAMQFREWDRQLRQPLLLSDGQAVVAVMPVDGVLHPRNVLDSLGADEAEKLCMPGK